MGKGHKCHNWKVNYVKHSVWSNILLKRLLNTEKVNRLNLKAAKNIHVKFCRATKYSFWWKQLFSSKIIFSITVKFLTLHLGLVLLYVSALVQFWAMRLLSFDINESCECVNKWSSASFGLQHFIFRSAITVLRTLLLTFSFCHNFQI